VTEDYRGHRADAAHPEQATDETGDGEAARSAFREQEGGRVSVERGVESGVEPPLAIAALDGRFLDFERTIGARFHERAPKRARLREWSTTRSGPGIAFGTDYAGFIGIEMSNS